MNPSGFYRSGIFSISGGQQVGNGYGTATGGDYHALLWTGVPSPVTDLNPSGFVYSTAESTDGARQAGFGWAPITGGNAHALLWDDTPASVVDLHPSGFSASYAEGISGARVVGYGAQNSGGPNLALLWTEAETPPPILVPLSLHPPGFYDSQANGISGDQQVGWGSLSAGVWPHALLWRGTAESFVDLHPSGPVGPISFFGSYALATNGTHQVGEGRTSPAGEDFHALLWSGSASSVVDLHPFLQNLPTSFANSTARGIDAQGNIVGYAWNAAGFYHAILWHPVPEPGAFAMLVMALVCCLVCVSRRRGLSKSAFRIVRFLFLMASRAAVHRSG